MSGEADTAHSSKNIVYITREENFSAAHRLHSEKLSTEQNKNVFGKCNNPQGHGHNYKLLVTLRGPVDPVTGMVYDLSKLKELLREKVVDQLDHKNLDLDVPYFFHNKYPSTAENICIFIWKQLFPILHSILYEVKIRETDANTAIYRGEHM